MSKAAGSLRVLALTVAGLLLAGCVGSGAPESPSPSTGQIGLGVMNATALTITLSVNGEVIETLRPGSADKAIPMTELPPLPWLVEIRTSSGRVLVSMTVDPIDVPAADDSDTMLHSGKYFTADLSCGELSMWTGGFEPSHPSPGPGSPGDCVP